MSYTRYRASSPNSGGFFDPMRASTGNTAFGSELDPYYYPPRTAYDGYNASRISGDRHLDPYYRTYYQPRRSPLPNDDWASDWQPSSSKPYLSSDKPSTSRTPYTVRPRSNTSSVADPNRRPLSVIVPSSPNRLEGVRSPRQHYYYAQDDGDRYITPASSLPARHRRIVSADDRGPKSPAGDKEVSGRPDRSSYVSSGEGKRRTYLVPPVGGKPRDVDAHDAYSYTNAREQFYRDSDAIRDYRRENHRRRKERPLSLAGLERHLPQLSSDPKYTKPASSSRQFDRSEKDESRLPPERKIDENKPPRTSDMSHRRTSYRMPISVHQDREAPAYRGEDDAYKESRKNRERYDDYPTKDGHFHQSSRHDGHQPAPIPTGLATAGLASGYSRDLRGREYESDADPRLEHYRLRESDRRREPRRSERPVEYDESGSETDEYHSDMEAGRYRHQPIGRRKDRRGDSMNRGHEYHEKDSKENESDSSSHRQPSRRQHERVHLDDKPTESGYTSDSRKTKVQPIDPIGKELEVVPKSILKTPTEKFPEDKNAVREGVAPLKDAHKKGIPPGARWTKIDRRLVSPAALEGQERYEERSDYVIVLRVLSREEIQDYAIKTAEIRSRYDSRRRRRDESDERRRHYDTDYESSEDEKEPKALPAPKSPPDLKRSGPADSHSEPIKMWLQRS